jgi:hypothetical protein
MIKKKNIGRLFWKQVNAKFKKFTKGIEEAFIKINVRYLQIDF